MSIEPFRADLVAALESAARWLESCSIPAVVVGGVAASILGRARFTQDVDFLVDVPESRWADLVSAASQQGLSARIPDAVAFARESRVLLMRHDASGIDIDVIVGALQFELDLIAAGSKRKIGPLVIRLPRVEDLMIMKAFAHRPRDLDDLAALLAANPQADIAVVRRWVREFASAASMPDILADFERLLSASRSPDEA